MTTALERFQTASIHWLNLGGTRVAYRRFGSGPAVVMVHGWPLSGITYRDLIDELREDFTCYVLDLPGAGNSPWDPSIRRSFQEFGALVLRFINELKLDRFALVGHDSGGAVARFAAAQAGDRVTAMAFTNTELPGHNPPILKVLETLVRMPGAESMFRLLLNSRAFRRSVYGFATCFEDTSLIDGDFHEASIKPILRDFSGPVSALRKAEPELPDLLERAHSQLKAPMLCVWGDKDPWFPYSEAKVMVERYLGDARIEVIKGKKLFVHEESPAEVAALIRPFLLEHHKASPVKAIGA